MEIRTFQERDRAAVVALWDAADLTRPWNDPDRDLDRKLADSPWGLLVAVDGAPEVEDAAVVGVAMVGYDGHRGSVNYLAVDPSRRGCGVGGALMDHAEVLLRTRGCPKIDLRVRGANTDVIAFYGRRGYALEGASHAVNLGLRLVVDDPRD